MPPAVRRAAAPLRCRFKLEPSPSASESMRFGLLRCRACRHDVGALGAPPLPRAPALPRMSGYTSESAPEGPDAEPSESRIGTFGGFRRGSLGDQPPLGASERTKCTPARLPRYRRTARQRRNLCRPAALFRVILVDSDPPMHSTCCSLRKPTRVAPPRARCWVRRSSFAWRRETVGSATASLSKSGSMYSTIGSGTASQAAPQGRRHKRAEVGLEQTIERLPTRCLDHSIRPRHPSSGYYLPQAGPPSPTQAPESLPPYSSARLDRVRRAARARARTGTRTRTRTRPHSCPYLHFAPALAPAPAPVIAPALHTHPHLHSHPRPHPHPRL